MKAIIYKNIITALICAKEALTLKSGQENFQFQDKILIENIPFPGSITVYLEGKSLSTGQLQCTFSVFKNYTEWKKNLEGIKCKGTQIMGLSTKHSVDHWKMTTNKKDDATDARIILERVKTDAAPKLDYLIIACCLIQENVKSLDPAILRLVALPEVHYLVDIGSVENKKRNYAEPHLIEIAPCPCDITTNNCDTFCCCDQDCPATFQDTFDCFSGWYGGQRTEPFKNKSCSNYLEHVDPVMCIYTANSAFLGYFYLDVSKIEDEASFSSIASDTTLMEEIVIKSNLNDYEKEKHSSIHQRHLRQNVTKPIYHYGDKIQVISNYTGVPKSAKWYFPVPIYDGSCTLTYPLHFLINLHSLCNVHAENICKQETLSNTLLDARTFVTEALFLLQAPGSSIPVQTNVTYLCAKNIAAYTKYNLINISAFSEIISCISHVQPPSPKYQNGICYNVVLEVRYNLFWQNGNIVLRNTTIIVGDILILNRRNTFWNNISTPLLTQHFSVEFHYLMNITNSSVETVLTHEKHIESETRIKLRSGNPGYEIGLPVIAVVENNINSTAIFTVGNHLNLWNSDAEGRCDKAGRRPVLFGINSISGCSTQINLNQLNKSSCMELKSNLLATLNSLIPAEYLSKGGNPDTQDFDNFIPLLKKTLSFRETNKTTEHPFPSCHNLPNHIHLEIAYAETGRNNYTPVTEIIGARVRYRTTPRTPRCGPYNLECESSITFPLTSSVQFIRVSLTRERIKRYWYLGEVKYCNREICWEEMFYPFTNAFTADSVYEVFFWTSTLLLAAPLLGIIFNTV